MFTEKCRGEFGFSFLWSTWLARNDLVFNDVAPECDSICSNGEARWFFQGSKFNINTCNFFLHKNIVYQIKYMISSKNNIKFVYLNKKIELEVFFLINTLNWRTYNCFFNTSNWK